MAEIRFTSEVAVEEGNACCGTDRDVAKAAWALGPTAWGGRNDDEAGHKRVIAACIKLRHNSPFEHGLLSVYARVPGVVWWQLTRQRFMSLDSEDFSFNLESGRYRKFDGLFYVPPGRRPLFEPDGFKPMRPELALGEQDQRVAVELQLKAAIGNAWDEYQFLLAHNVAREVARLVLPNWALVIGGYVTGKPLTWLQFFSKRNRTADTATPTFPQWEIEQFAARCEALFAARWPMVHAAFLENGRAAP